MIGPLIHSSLVRRGIAPTIVDPDGRELTGAQLHDMASELASELAALGIGPGDAVAIQIPQVVEQVGALVAIAYTGAEFALLDLDVPQARTARFLESVDPVCVLSVEDLLPGFSPNPRPWVLQARSAGTGKGARFAPSLTPSGYFVQTSGTTGSPKVLRVDGRALENRLRWGQSVYPLNWADVVLATSRPSFDFYIWELLAPLCFGAKLALTSVWETANAKALLDRCIAEGATMMHFSPGCSIDSVTCWRTHPPTCRSGGCFRVVRR